MTTKLLILDSNNLYAVTYYALKGDTSKLIDSFIGHLRSIIEKEQDVTHLITCWDSAESRKRKETESYKAGRSPKPENYYNAFEPLQKRLAESKVQLYQEQGVEADDIIAKIVKAARKKSYQCVIVSSDKDMYQLLPDDEQDKSVYIYSPQKAEWFDAKNFIDKYGIKPSQYKYVKSLMGDASDNIQGVQGVGETTALKAIVAYGSLDGLYSSDFKQVQKRFVKALKEGKEDAYKSLNQVRFIEDFQLAKTTCAELPELFMF